MSNKATQLEQRIARPHTRELKTRPVLDAREDQRSETLRHRHAAPPLALQPEHAVARRQEVVHRRIQDETRQARQTRRRQRDGSRAEADSEQRDLAGVCRLTAGPIVRQRTKISTKLNTIISER